MGASKTSKETTTGLTPTGVKPGSRPKSGYEVNTGVKTTREPLQPWVKTPPLGWPHPVVRTVPPAE
jgi:hypothetical protein